MLEQQPGMGFASLICSKSFSLPHFFLLLLFEACYKLKTNSYFRGGGEGVFMFFIQGLSTGKPISCPSALVYGGDTS